jgi:hypothetical protein
MRLGDDGHPDVRPLTATGLRPEIACRDQETPLECEEARSLWQWACTIEEEATDCVKAKQFIEEHMRN